jgi:hypothetical protein
MNYSPRESPRRLWCAALAKLVSPSFPDDAAAALCDILPALKHLPEPLFNEDTLIQVAGTKRRQTIPAFDEILVVLNAYRRDFIHEPPRPALTAPPDALPETGPNMTPEQREAVLKDFGAKWAAMKAESLASSAEPKPPPLRDVTLKGEALRKSREERGLNVPAPARSSEAIGQEPEPEHEEALF